MTYEIDYKQGKVYKLISSITDEIYVGSTCEPLSARFQLHESSNNGCSSKKLFVQGAKVSIELVEFVPCAKKSELKVRELYWQDTLRKQGIVINRNKPFITDIEICGSDRKEWNKDYCAAYRVANKTAIAEQKKEYYLVNAPAIAEQKKEYYAANKTTIREKQNVYADKNREKKNARARELYAEKKALKALQALHIG